MLWRRGGVVEALGAMGRRGASCGGGFKSLGDLAKNPTVFDPTGALKGATGGV